MSLTIYHFINFIILAGVLAFILKAKLPAFFQAQRAIVQKDLESARIEYEAVKSEFEKARNLIEGFSSESESLRKQILSETDLEAKKIKADAISFVEKLAAATEQRLQGEAQRAKAQFQQELVAAAVSAAREAAKKEFSSRDEAWTADLIQADRTNGNTGKKHYAS